MPHDDRVSAYVAAAPAFAVPILEAVRAAVHEAAPDITETVKWGMPFFTRNGRDVAMMAAFKAHAGVGIFDGSPMAGKAGMGNLGKLTGVADLPDDLPARLAAAAALAEAGKPVKAPGTAVPKAEIPVPADLAAALAAAAGAAAGFNALPPGARREYLEWVTSAKQPATRQRRIETTVAQAAEGRKLNWKYERC